MKKIINILIFAFALIQLAACSKDENESNNPDIMKKKSEVVTDAPPCLTCPPPDPYVPNNWTDAELIEMGTQVGCNLSKTNGYFYGVKVMQVDASGQPLRDAYGNILYTTINTSNYTVYLRTINNLDFPELYREGVREGWLQCFNRGQYINSCATTALIASSNADGSVLFQVKPVCQWLGLTN